MFNLIVKDPDGFPPERTALDRRQQPAFQPFACPRTCCAVFLRELIEIIQSHYDLSSKNFPLPACLLFPRTSGLASLRKPPYSAKLSNIYREHSRVGRLATLMEYLGRNKRHPNSCLQWIARYGS